MLWNLKWPWESPKNCFVVSNSHVGPNENLVRSERASASLKKFWRRPVPRKILEILRGILKQPVEVRKTFGVLRVPRQIQEGLGRFRMDPGRTYDRPTRLLLLGGHFPSFEQSIFYSPRVSCSRRGTATPHSSLPWIHPYPSESLR